MGETLIQIVQSIQSCNKDRIGTRVNPIARVHCRYDGKIHTYWFTNDTISIRDIGQLITHGHFVSKNSKIAVKMQTMGMGVMFKHECPNHLKRKQIHNILLENRSDFQNKKIEIAGDELTYQYRDISEFLKALSENQKEIKELKDEITKLKRMYDESGGNPDHRRQIKKTLTLLQRNYRILTQQQEDLQNITIYIRNQNEMRYSLIVDVIQTRIKTRNLFDGRTVIIDGGPGTGKSTTMIHRLAYLRDKDAIIEDHNDQYDNYKLNDAQRFQLIEAIDKNRDWMFFSPSKLLKDYLAHAMIKEGLGNVSEKVWNWSDYCRIVLQINYKVLEINENKAPFRPSKIKGTLFIQNSGILNELMNFYLQQFRSIKSYLPVLNTTGKVNAWTSLALNIAKKFEASENYELSQFISLFNSLHSVYGEECKIYLNKNKIAIEELADKICDLLDKNAVLKSEISEILSLSSDENDENDDIENDTEYDSTLSQKKEEKTHDCIMNNDHIINIEIQKWIRAYCSSDISNKQLSDKYQLISICIKSLLEDKYDSEFLKIKELMIFEQYAQYTKGVKTLMLNCIPSCYKKFRLHLRQTKFKGCDLELLRDIMRKNQGKELHHQEQSLLLGFINTIVKQIKIFSGRNVDHNYITAYDELSRPIIGIDEATDFSSCDIYAMQSFLTQGFYSLTLCGDMMQRLTDHGIKSWGELDEIVPNPIVVELKTSYRQSKKLLDVAKGLYQDTVGDVPKYNAFMKSKKVPDPLVFIDANEFAKIEWISKRISEVHRAYGSDKLPSIAIFVTDKGYIPRFINHLQQTDFFLKTGIKILDGTIPNFKIAENFICVYPIDVVKGMEFDVVFFHNIDNFSDNLDMLKRHIYVGVSRAAFFLGITLNERNDKICKYFQENKDWFKI